MCPEMGNVVQHAVGAEHQLVLSEECGIDEGPSLFAAWSAVVKDVLPTHPGIETQAVGAALQG